MKAFPAVLLLSGAAAVVAGVITRACAPDVSSQLANAWCGPALQTLLGQAPSFVHQHCAGCAMLVAGAGMVATSLLVAVWDRLNAAPLAVKVTK